MKTGKVLHITNHIGTISNLNNVFTLLGKPEMLITIKCPLRLHVSEEYANILWASYSEIAKDFDTVIITDTLMYSRSFLQNIDKHHLNIIIYVTNRFDWGFFYGDDYDKSVYTKLLANASRNPRVRFCSDNRYDQYYCSIHNIQFYYGDIIRLTPPLREPVSPINNKAFVYDRGTPLHRYINAMPDNRIEYDVFGGEGYPRFRDMAHISEYKCIFHLPYQTNIQGLWENLGYGNIYLIPSKRFLKELVDTAHWYYWEEKSKGGELLQKSLDLAEWYQPELANFFVYFDYWEDIHNKFYHTDFMEKKRALYAYMQKHNRVHIGRWAHLLDSLDT